MHTDPGHEGDIELLGWEWSVGPAAGDTVPCELSVHKRVDRASPLFRTLCAERRRLPLVELLVRRSEESDFDYVALSLFGAGVDTVHLRSEGEESPLREEVALHLHDLVVRLPARG